MFLRLAYNLAFGIFGIVYLPVFISKNRGYPERKRLLAERLGFFSKERKKFFEGKKWIWVHAVSVGEAMAVETLIRKCSERFPDTHFLVTTVTATGQKIAQKMANEKVHVAFFPFDFTFAVKSFFQTFRPECLILVETEIWPNLLTEAERFHVPVGIVNGRLSERSSGRYLKWRFIFGGLFRKIRFVLAQTEEDAGRFTAIGLAKDRVHVMGNIKFDNAVRTEELKGEVARLKEKYFLGGPEKVWVAGSTHPGEEEWIAGVFQKLRKDFPGMKLVIAPRHVERAREVCSIFEKKGLRSFPAGKITSGEYDVLVIDRLGVLRYIYAAADVVFVGGSLVPKGGQNPIEPANVKKTVVYGKHVFNFEKIYQILKQREAAVQVRDADELEPVLRELLNHELKNQQIGERAYAVVQSMCGATDRHVHWLSEFLSASRKG